MALFRLLFLAVILLFSTSVQAVQPDEILPDAALEARARALSAELRCLVCQNESIDDSNAPLARDLRLLVRERLVLGDSDQQVVDFLVERYGEYVLLKPRFEGRTWLLWTLPFIVLGLAALAILLRILLKRPTKAEPLDAEEKAALKRILANKNRS